MEMLKELLQSSAEPFSDNANFIVCMVLTSLIIIFAIECCRVHVIIVQCSNFVFVLGLIVTIVLFVGWVINGSLRLDFIAISISAVITLAIRVAIFVKKARISAIAEYAYKSKRVFNIDNIDTNKLRELIIECQQSGIDLTERKCNCDCKFGSIRKSECIMAEEGEECIVPFCEDSVCSVFNTTVDYVTSCVWNEQDRINYEYCKCLLSKITGNSELKELVEKVCGEVQ